jgi:hypothetical protein
MYCRLLAGLCATTTPGGPESAASAVGSQFKARSPRRSGSVRMGLESKTLECEPEPFAAIMPATGFAW